MRQTERMPSDKRVAYKLRCANEAIEAGNRILLIHGIVGGACGCRNPNCKSPGKHPISVAFPHGLKSATRDIAKIRRWLKRYPDANLAMVPDGQFLVVDVDGDKGRQTIARFNLPPTTTVISGRGYHAYYLADGLKGWKAPNLEGVDFRYNGNGYILIPPSRHVNGSQYRWRREPEFAKIPLDIFGPKQLGSRKAPAQVQTVREGGRNNFLTSVAGFLRNKGLDETQLTAALHAMNASTCVPPLDDQEVERIAGSVGSYPLPKSAFADLADVAIEAVEWLFKPYFPLGALTMMDGDPGIGKSSLVAALLASVTRGSGVPWSSDKPHGKVLILSAEDDPARILKPRLQANGADFTPGVVRFVQVLFSLDEKGIELLRTEVAAHLPILVVIDPIVAFIGQGEDLHKASDMTRFLGRIDEIAREFDCAILIVRHLRKSTDGDALRRGLGSIALAGRVRSVVAVTRHPDDRDSRVMVHVKSNYAREGATVLFSLVEVDDVSRVEWLGVDTELTASTLFEMSAEPGRPPNQKNAVRDFLERQLAAGECASADVFRGAEARAHARITVERTSREMKIVKTRRGQESYWRLPDDYASTEEEEEKDED